MNTDKIFAEAIANEYAPKGYLQGRRPEESWTEKAKGPANIFAYSFGVLMTLIPRPGDVPFHAGDRRRAAS